MPEAALEHQDTGMQQKWTTPKPAYCKHLGSKEGPSKCQDQHDKSWNNPDYKGAKKVPPPSSCPRLAQLFHTLPCN